MNLPSDNSAAARAAAAIVLAGRAQMLATPVPIYNVSVFASNHVASERVTARGLDDPHRAIAKALDFAREPGYLRTFHRIQEHKDSWPANVHLNFSTGILLCQYSSAAQSPDYRYWIWRTQVKPV
jgi:hypothetical protein